MKKIFIGIDFSKEKFDATLIQAEGLKECAPDVHEVFDNKTSGYRRLVKWVKAHAEGFTADLWLFCGENTGGYSIALCNYLYASGYDMWLECAYNIKHSAGIQRVKNDKADSRAIAEYAMRNNDKMIPYKPQSSSLNALREVFLYRHSLVKQKVSSCFGAAFLLLHPTKYAEELAKKLTEHNATAYLVNTGWTGGGYGVGSRISLKATRAIISAILNDELIGCETEIVKPFNLSIPKHVNGVDDSILNPQNSWTDKAAYAASAKQLAESFIKNFNNFTETEEGKKLVPFGPVVE